MNQISSAPVFLCLQSDCIREIRLHRSSPWNYRDRPGDGTGVGPRGSTGTRPKDGTVIGPRGIAGTGRKIVLGCLCPPREIHDSEERSGFNRGG